MREYGSAQLITIYKQTKKPTEVVIFYMYNSLIKIDTLLNNMLDLVREVNTWLTILYCLWLII